ncbi:MAG: chemotaxis protein CheW [Proteobacteria bacterium]|nr:chemotaxis protein CheW [Pseudomonadota bacterium]
MAAITEARPAPVAETGRERVAAGQTDQPLAQFLTFTLSGELFAIGILSVKEIIEYHRLTEVPMMPESVRGVINLRGAAVPVLDLQARFGRPAATVGKRTCIVIVEIEAGSDRQVVGMIVDAVDEVIEIAASEILPPPSLGTRIRADFIRGMGKIKGRFVIVLDADRIFSRETMAAVVQLSALDG